MATLTQFKLTPKDGTGDALTAFLKSILSDTRSYAGCTGAEFGISSDDPKTVLLIEQWDTVTAFDAYLSWRVERGDFAKLNSLLSENPEVTHFMRG